MPSRILTLKGAATLLLSVVALLASYAATASAANQRVDVLRPVKTEKRVLSFDLGEAKPAASITRASVRIKARRAQIRRELKHRYRGRPVAKRKAFRRMRARLQRTMRLRYVRRSATTGQMLRVKKPSWSGPGRLTLVRTTPQTLISGGPRGPVATASASFEFSASMAIAGFQCRVDSADWSPCSSPHTLTELPDGAHRFDVQAVDDAGVPLGAAASRYFRVDTIAPATTLLTGPSDTIATASASFGFSTPEEGSGFNCKLDAEPWQRCASPKSYSSLANGEHTFQVRAVDAAGNVDPTPEIRSFVVDAPAPLYSVDNVPSHRWNMFSDESPWNAGIADGSRIDPNSKTMIGRMLADGGPAPESATSNQNWGIPIYYARASDPVYRLGFTGRFDYTREIDGAAVHVPAGAKPSSASDGVIWIVDQTDGFVYALQRTVIDHSARTIDAWKGYRLAADGSGFRYPSGPPTGVQPIRPEELEAGYVNHTMSMGVRCLSGHPVAPFDQSLTVGKPCSGDENAASTRLSMGNVVFLDMTRAEIEALSIPTWQKAILRGLADHGAVVGLNGGAAWSLKFENRLGRTSLGKPDPYAQAGLPSTLNYSDALDEVGGWERNLEVLKPFPRPCSGVC